MKRDFTFDKDGMTIQRQHSCYFFLDQSHTGEAFSEHDDISPYTHVPIRSYEQRMTFP